MRRDVIDVVGVRFRLRGELDIGMPRSGVLSSSRSPLSQHPDCDGDEDQNKWDHNAGDDSSHISRRWLG